MRISRKVGTGVALALAAAGLAGVGPVPAFAGAAGPAPASLANPDAALGAGWRSSTDVAVAGAGDSAGFHVLVAREDSGFQFYNLVTLVDPAVDTGLWTGQVCTTGDDRYAVAVYAPSNSVNDPAARQAGALASVVDLTTGVATPVAAGVQLAYYSPACGPGDTAILTRALGSQGERTQLLHVDAAHARVASVVTVDAEVTTPVPAPDGDYAMVGGQLAKIDGAGRVTALGRPDGVPFTLVATAHDGIDLATAAGHVAEIERWTGHGFTRLGTGPLADLNLYRQSGGADLIVGDTSGIRAGSASGIRTLTAAAQPAAVSAEGHLAVSSVLPLEVRDIAAGAPGVKTPVQDIGRIEVNATATGSGATIAGTLAAQGPTAQWAAPSAGSSVGSGSSGAAALAANPGAVQRPAAASAPPPQNPTAANDADIAVEQTANGAPPSSVATPSCLVGRNDPTRQVLQPTPQMVEWAADQAVHGDLKVSRPANYLATGEPAYTPQGMFPPVALTNGGSVPAQVMLGILAQESNFKQASWHAVAGDSGNPLVSDYYGTTYRNSAGQIVVPADDANYLPDYAASDCGYGIAQVTTGMNGTKPNPFSTAQASAVATDYAANIAAGLQILQSTWNQLATMSPPMTANNGNSAFIENWYMAIWGYNSGVYAQSAAPSNNGHYGLGWLNNPANPIYPSNRHTFLTVAADANTPQDWPYEDLVMGWIEHGQYSGSSLEYAYPTMGTSMNGVLNVPGNITTQVSYGIFCSTSVNSCNYANVSNPCPAVSNACWWNQPDVWIPTVSTASAASEKLTYALGSAEPAMQAHYPADCESAATFYGNYAPGTLLVNDLNNPDQNVRGCVFNNSNGTGRNDGKFTIRLGDNYATGSNYTFNVIQANPYSAQIDLHQIGAGFLGHFYFTHTYDPGTNGGVSTSKQFFTGLPFTVTAVVPAAIEHKVTGTWTPNIPAGTNKAWYSVFVAVPDHGANATAVTYHIDPGGLSAQPVLKCTVSQNISSGNNTWFELGVYQLSAGADVWLDNMSAGATGSQDVAFSSMFFEPAASSGPQCPTGTAG